MNVLPIALALVAVASPSSVKRNQVFTSPDGALRAIVRKIGPTDESRVQIQDRSKRVLLTRDETSDDGEHGYVVVHAAWTSDSQFFVATTMSSGGHQPWAYPIWVYSRAKNRVIELDRIGATAVADFTLKAPDVIHVKVLDCKNPKPLESRPVTFSLHQLMSTEHLPPMPCSGP